MNKIFNTTALFEIERNRYDELVAAEEQLRLLKHAVAQLPDYTGISELKAIFAIEKKEGQAV